MPQSATDKLEKNRQSAASLFITNLYVYLFAAFIALLTVRNIIRCAHRWSTRRSRAAEASADVADQEKAKDRSGAASQQGNVTRYLSAVDSLALRPAALGVLPADVTWARLLVCLLYLAINFAFCLITDTHLTHASSIYSNVARAFSRRCGRMAIANTPILFLLAGRNNIVCTLTGIEYQDLRVYHKLIGYTAIVQAIIHTVSYVIYYAQGPGMEKLYEEYEELYFKLGIMATFAMVACFAFSLRWIRSRAYEFFLISHVLGAACYLAGMWYHRPIIESWVEATVGIWLAERLFRLVRHFVTSPFARLTLRKPVVTAQASVVEEALILRIPFPEDGWKAGQHCYLSFWGVDLLKKPWLYGQAHPFSIANVPFAMPGDDNHSSQLEFVIRISDGLTKTLAQHVGALTAKKSEVEGGVSQTVPLTVSIDGPYGTPSHVDAHETVVLIAGGSGITHVASVAADCIRQAKDAASVTKKVKLIWALRSIDQLRWVGDGLHQLRTLAAEVRVDLEIALFVTGSSGCSTPTTPSPLLRRSMARSESAASSLDEKADAVSDCTKDVAVAVGRPKISNLITETVLDSPSKVLIVACGPKALTDGIVATVHALPTSNVTLDIASFQY